jgi:hypothetical protein
MDTLALLTETVAIPSAIVGAVWVGMITAFRGKVPAHAAAMAQPLLMAAGFSVGVICVLDRVPFPPSDSQGRLTMSAGALALMFSMSGLVRPAVHWQAGLAVLGTAVATLAVLPRSIAPADVVVTMLVAAGISGFWALSFLPPITISSGLPLTGNKGPADEAANTDPGQYVGASWVSAPFLLALGSSCSFAILLGGSASYAQLAGVVCSIAGPFIVFGLFRKDWGLHPEGTLFALGLFVLLLVVGVRLASAQPAAIIPLALAPVVMGSPAWLGRYSNSRWLSVVALLLSLILLVAGVGFALAFQPKESW